MTFKEIKELVELISASDLREFRLRDKEFSIKIRTDKDTGPPVVSASPLTLESVPQPAQAAPPSPPVSQPSAEETSTEEKTQFIEIKSPMVGTFYRSPSPDKPAYIQVGDTIKTGSVVCIIEAMKLFNEIESEVAGKIVKVVAEDASPVEYDQVLFLVDPGA